MTAAPGSPRHLLVIGGQRCGTTYLHDLLDGHRDVAMARPCRPEPKVFLSDEIVERGAQWYRATYFGHRGEESLLGEKSTSYLEDPRAAERARRVLGDEVVVLALLRDPVDRAVSNWRFSTDHGLEDRDLVEALTDNLREARPWDPAATSVSPYAYLERGRYADLLAPWAACFPRTLHVLFTEELVGHPAEQARLVAALGLDPGARRQPDPGTVNASTAPARDLPAELHARLRQWFAACDSTLAALVGREVPWREERP